MALLPFIADPLAAQQRGASRREAPTRQTVAQSGTERRAQAIRAEYAAVLLQSGRYREAAREYRTLVASAPRNADYRLALARALAWGGQPRDADPELRALRALRPTDPSIVALLRSTRESYEPTSREAGQWVVEDPGFAPYRLALARALVRERAPSAAVPHYDVLLALGRPIESRPAASPAALQRESAEAHAAAGDRAGSVRVLRDALARTPGDTTTRHAFALVLAGGGQLGEALAQYDSLLASASGLPDVSPATIADGTWSRPRAAARASLLLERAQVHVARGDVGAAENDAMTSLSTLASVDAFLLLGDLHRWRGQYASARTSYERARMLDASSRAVAAAFTRLAREEHPALAFAPVEGGEEGWRGEVSAVGDNLGVLYATSGAGRGVALPGRITAGVGAEYRLLTEHSALRSVALHGFAAEAAISSDAQVGVVYGRVGAHAGVVSHPGLGAFPEGSISGAGWYRAWGLGLDVRSALAYPSLLTVASLRPSLARPGFVGAPSPTDQPLQEHGVTASIAGPIARADVALVGQRSRISDGNVRTTVQLYTRVPLAPRLALIYAGSGLRFAERSPLYWDPIGYVSNATGIEYAVRRARGLAYAVQLLPGVAWAHEIPLDAVGRELRRTAPQFTGTGDAAYRRESWEVGAALTYNRGRAGSYERLGGSVQWRMTP